MYSIEKIADYIDGEIFGDSKLIIKGLCGIDNGKNNHISYIHEKQYFRHFKVTKASAVIIENQHNFPLEDKTVIKVDNAAKAFSKLIDLFHKKKNWDSFISKTAVINSNSKIGNKSVR